MLRHIHGHLLNAAQLARALSIDGEAVLGHPVAGASWEGFVIQNILRAAPERSPEDLNPDRCFVVYSGDERYLKSEGVEVIGPEELC